MESTQEKLLAIASNLFADKGFAGVSMRDIAAASGITQAAIYHHFANKEALYYASVGHLLNQMLTPLTGTALSETEPEKKLAIFVDGLMRMAIENPQVGRIYYRELLDGDLTRLLTLVGDVFLVLQSIIDDVVLKISPHTDGLLAVISLLGMILHHAEVIKLAPALPGGKLEHTQVAVLSKHITELYLNGLKGNVWK